MNEGAVFVILVADVGKPYFEMFSYILRLRIMDMAEYLRKQNKFSY